MKMDANQRGKEDKSEWEISFEKRRKREREKKKKNRTGSKKKVLISCLYPKREGVSHVLSTVET